MTIHSIAPQVLASGLNLLQIEAWARVGMGHAINSLPEGVLIALFAWAVLGALPKQNSRTRFAVWFLVLAGVVAVVCCGGMMFSKHLRIFGTPLENSSGVSAVVLPAHWASYILIAWLLGAGAGILRLAVGLFRLRGLRQSSVRVDAADLDLSVRQTLAELNATKGFGARAVTLTTSDRVRVPAALGLWEPMIALPTWALAELPPSELNIILRHEFAHLQRWDDWTNLLQKFVRAVLFFHPAVWWIDNRLSIEREMACDDVVVAQTGNPRGYASCLVSLLERSLAQRGWTMAQAIVHRAREASDRLAQILDKNRPSGAGISKPALGLVGTFAALCVAMLPQTPQLVGFEHAPDQAAENYEYSAALAHPAGFSLDGRSPSLSATAIPASLKSGEMKADGSRTDSLESSRRGTAQYAAARAEASQRSSEAARVRLKATSESADREELAANEFRSGPETLFEVNAMADEDFHPMMETLVFVQTVQFPPAQGQGTDTDSMSGVVVVRPGSSRMMWSVQVWQITFVNPMMRQHARVPVANKI